MKKLCTRCLALLAVLLLAGCSWFGGPDNDPEKWSAPKLYRAAKAAMDTADYETAVKHLETLESRFPFGRYAQQAQLDIIYAYYKYDEPESAVAAADRFIKLYPRHPNVDYAYYMRGLASFTQGISALDAIFHLSPTERDPRAAREAFDYFTTLIKQFPQSPYARDAGQRLIFLYNNLARYELNVAQYYVRRGAYAAAANRAIYTLKTYPRSTSSRDALLVLETAYRRLGMDDLAQDTQRIINLNVPDHAKPPMITPMTLPETSTANPASP